MTQKLSTGLRDLNAVLRLILSFDNTRGLVVMCRNSIPFVMCAPCTCSVTHETGEVKVFQTLIIKLVRSVWGNKGRVQAD
jgi:hypothetical protein